MQNHNLKEAATDLRFLLSRGYQRRSAIELVGNRWNLNQEARHILYRAVFSLEEVKRRKWNEVEIEETRGKTVAIDAYNILITLESILKGLLLIKGDDGYLRDISRVFNKYKQSSYTLQSIQLILKKLQPYQPAKILFFLDQGISHSGELAALIRGELKQYNMNGDAETVSQSDKSVETIGEVVISNDRVVLENALAHLNLISLLLKNLPIPEINLLDIL